MKLRKAIKDLLINPGRTILVIFALIIGLSGFGSVIVSYVILSHDLGANYKQTNPAHVILESTEFQTQDIEKLLANPEIESAEFRSFALLRIEVKQDEWIPLWLFGVDSFESIDIGKLAQEKGKAVPTPGTMLFERNGLKISSLKLESIANVRSGIKSFKVPISGITFDPAQAPATQDHFIYGYVDKETFAELSGKSKQERVTIRFKDVNSKEEVATKTDTLINDLKLAGSKVQKVKIPNFNEHPHQWQLDTLLLVIGSIGLLAFLMSAVLVSQLIASMLAQQVRQIGILKAIGGRKSQIVSIYVIMLLFFGITSSVIAVPLSISAGYAYSYFVASVLNFNILTTTLPAYVILLLISVGVFFPLILSYRIINDGVKVSVRDAFDDYGVKMKKPLLTKKKLKLQFLPDEIVIAFRNTFRKKGRLAIMIISMALGVAIFSTGFNVRQSLSNLVQNVDKSLQYDVQVVLSAPITFEESEKLFGSLENLAYSEGWNGGTGLMQSNQVSNDNEIGIIALPYDTDLLKLKIVEGSWLSTPGTADIVINQQAIKSLGLPKIGDEVKLMIKGTETSFRLKGIAENFDAPKIYMDAATYDQLTNKDHLTNSIMLVSKKRDYDSVVSFKKGIERTIEDSNVSVLYVMSQSERVKIIYDHLNIILTTILFLAFLVLMVSALGMSSAMSINIMERKREIGIMRAIGASPKKIVTIFVTEGMIICLISIVIGLALAQPLSALASIFFGNLVLGETAMLGYAFSFIGMLITIVTTVMIGYFASRTPAKNIINQPVQSMGVY